MSTWLRRNAVVVVLVAIAAGIATWTFTRSPAEGAEQRRIASARARLAACLLGEPVTHMGPDITRLRAVQLAGAAGWPKRCAPYAAALEHVLPHHGGGSIDQGSRALAGGKLFENYSLQHDIAALLTPEADEPIVPLADVARDVPPPPPPARLPHEAAAVVTRAWPVTDLGDHDLAVLFEDELACRFAERDGGLEPVAHCTYPGDALATSHTRWVRATAAADLQVIADDGIHAFATGERLLATATAAQASNVAGTLFVWPADATRTSVVRRASTGATTVLRLPHKLDESATLLGDQLLWTENDRVVGISLAGPTTGAVYEVAKAAHLPQPDLCATSQIAATLLVGRDDQHRVAVLANGTWRVSSAGPRYELHCSGATVTGFSTDPRADGLEIDRIDCDAAGCTTTNAILKRVTAPYAVAAIGKDTIVVWADDLVRGVSGPLAGLATATPFAVFDGATYENLSRKQIFATELIHMLDVVGRGSSAIVVLHGDRSWLVHVRDGKPERVDIELD